MHFVGFILLLLLLPALCLGQDPGLSQWHAVPVLLNPAFASAKLHLAFGLLHRDQWPALRKAYRTQVAAAQGPIQRWGAGWMGKVVHDSQANGALQRSTIGLGFAKGVQLGEDWWFHLGMNGDLVTQSLDPSQLTYADQLDPYYGSIYSSAENRAGWSVVYPDWSVGGLLHSTRWLIGWSGQHLAPATNDATTTNGTPLRKWTSHLSGRFSFSDDDPKGWYWMPNVVWQQQGPFTFLNVGWYAENEHLSFGAWYRHNIGLVGLFGLSLEKLRIGYSYDFTFLPFAGSRGAHELSLRYVHPVRKQWQRKFKRKRLPCPVF
ncbi:MAG: PorP/SprF family type IX secretion system membrane protein [Salibacteraceae bacterium]